MAAAVTSRKRYRKPNCGGCRIPRFYSLAQANAPARYTIRLPGRVSIDVMASKWQFSLAYLFLTIFWFALALALTRWLFTVSDDWWVLRTILFPAGAISWGAALGGLVGRMRQGALFAGAALLLLVIWMII